ncbi:MULTISPECIES: DUF3572 domain-containing protein [Shimia]|uniref:DUF3572 domain-containing protein n=1 Tax=Shimia TaxID=573139 RepID=UPI001FB3C45A|nr:MULTISPECIES: DUF3572 domain-containing protein [Shimia]MDV4143634.1 DUF3572 domain-containing protein [Shimia sp. FJ5]
MNLSKDAAETLALQALGWLVNNDELMPVFLGATGASVDDLKDQAGDPDFLASVLEFLTMDDAWVVAFCDSVREDYMTPMMARQVLLGESGRHWT